MKKYLVVAALMAVSSAAWGWCAQGYQEKVCGTLHVCYQGAAPACPTAGTSQEQWQAQVQAQQQGQQQSSTNVSTNLNTNANTNVNANTSTSSATGGTSVATGGNSRSNSSVGDTTATGGEGGAGGAGGAGGSATGGNATGGSVKNAGNSAIKDSGNSAVKNAGNNVGAGGGAKVTVEGDKVEAQDRNPVNTAFAGTQLVVQTDSCRTGFGVGGQAVTFGFTMSGTARDENCELLKLNRELVLLGFKDAAVELLKGDERVKAAFERLRGKPTKDQRSSNQYDGRDVTSFVPVGITQ